MKQLWNYIKTLSQADSNESSKRFLAMYVTLILITFLVVGYTDKSNVELIVGELITFVLALVGIGAWEKRNKSKYNDEGC